MHRNIFRKYDIRGVFKKDFGESDITAIARAISHFTLDDGIAHKNICIGYDGRLSSPIIREALLYGLMECGYSRNSQRGNIVDIGICSTPMLYWAAYNIDNIGVAIMITGSHNPKEYNGLKIIYNMSYAAEDFLDRIRDFLLGNIWSEGKDSKIKLHEQEAAICSLHADLSSVHLNKLNFKSSDLAESFGNSLEQLEIGKAYLNSVLAAKIPAVKRKLSIAWDLSNGAMCRIVPEFIKRLQGEHFLLNSKIDGNFPNHLPDPTCAKNLEQLSAFIREKNCDFGICFDGDGDRIGIVLKNGRILYGDHILLLIAHDMILNSTGHKVLVDLRMNQFVIDQIRNLGCDVVIWQPGHSKIKNKMKEDDITIAAEMSGHIFFNLKRYICDDALIAAYKIYELFLLGYDFERILEPISHIIKTEEIRIPIDEKLRLLMLFNIKSYLTILGIEFEYFNGIRVANKNLSWNIRSAVTEEVISFNISAVSQEHLDSILALISSAILALESAMFLKVLN